MRGHSGAQAVVTERQQPTSERRTCAPAPSGGQEPSPLVRGWVGGPTASFVGQGLQGMCEAPPHPPTRGLCEALAPSSPSRAVVPGSTQVTQGPAPALLFRPQCPLGSVLIPFHPPSRCCGVACHLCQPGRRNSHEVMVCEDEGLRGRGRRVQGARAALLSGRGWVPGQEPPVRRVLSPLSLADQACAALMEELRAVCARVLPPSDLNLLGSRITRAPPKYSG